jgi:hypothetical protein
MRVLIADRNAWLLGSISRTFARQFRIQTATTREACKDLLRQGAFDLAIISEKLADGPGLLLLGQIARDSPDTLRIFAARRSRLQLLKGKLGPFGLFRTLAYPIDPQKLLSALTLARAGLEIDVPVFIPPPEIRNDPIEDRRAAVVSAARREVASPLQVPHAGAPVIPSRVPVRPSAERISLTSADATLVGNVPLTIESAARVRRSNSPSVSKPAPSVRQRDDRIQQCGMLQQAVLRSSVPRRTPPQRGSLQHAVPRREAPRLATAVRPRRKADLADTAPMRTKVMFGAMMVAVFLVTILALNLFDASAHVTRASVSHPEMARLDIGAPPWNSASTGFTPSFRPVQSVAPRAEPTPGVTSPDAEPVGPKVAASSAPIADPSTFGSEAYEPIYSN